MSNKLFDRPGDIRGAAERGRSHRSVNIGGVVPSPSTPQGGRDRLVLSEVLINNVNEDGFSWTDQVAYFVVDNPSVRLHLKVAIGFRPDTAEDTPFPAGGANAWMWQLDAWDRTADGRLIRSNNIFTNRPLPSSYEAITSNDQWRGKVTVPLTNTITEPGLLYVIATWEPAPGWYLDERKLEQIFQACHMRVNHGLNVGPA